MKFDFHCSFKGKGALNGSSAGGEFLHTAVCIGLASFSLPSFHPLTQSQHQAYWERNDSFKSRTSNTAPNASLISLSLCCSCQQNQKTRCIKTEQRGTTFYMIWKGTNNYLGGKSTEKPLWLLRELCKGVEQNCYPKINSFCVHAHTHITSWKKLQKTSFTWIEKWVNRH